MYWLYLALVAAAALIAFVAVIFWYVRWLGNREPYGTFLKLKTRRKVTFFRLLLFDKNKRVPLYVKIVPLALVLYLAMPFDIIPDFVPVLGYLDDVAIALLALVIVMRLLPRTVALELLEEAAGGGK
ncbi:MAG: DUF1232 domain-containing protein [SAR202 cluster bacterium]|nr:DUF1232 domain-containing protein [SAR202 cluster bacterium]